MDWIASNTGATAFDFFHGKWRVEHRRLVARLAGCSDWQEFGGCVEVRSILGGLGNFDENVIDLPAGRYVACTLRVFSPVSGQWSINWIDGRDPKLDPPMVGAFDNGVGRFFGNDSYEGKPIIVRFLWTPGAGGGPRWEQAFSQDGGETWETNWIMTFIRE